ncbi:unnamed protein product [Urochloa decumbens]|uniref:RING-CH-type domain-containing protein n=1 Tax=Urochloa decumbens TaxID=240449 RepID=A0ABC9GTE8_9POAL
MGLKEQHPQPYATDQTDAINSPAADDNHKPGIPRVSSCSTDKDSGLSLCRVCHCVEPDLRGESALGSLGIVPPSREPRTDIDTTKTSTSKDAITGPKDGTRFVEFISPEGEIFVCATDVESGPLHQQDHLVDLGCSCKNELALAHYACALKWFISHGSTVCEICGSVAANVRPDDFNKVLASLKDYEALRERTSTGELSYLQHVAGHDDQPPLSPSNNSVPENSVVAARRVHTRWSLESTGVLVAIGLAVIVLAWLVAPHVGKKAAVIGLHMLLGGLCALTLVISLRFVFPRIQYGSMQYWAILFVSWFLVFGVWASRTRSIRSS